MTKHARASAYEAVPNSLAHGWEILDVAIYPSNWSAEATAELWRGPRGCGWQVRVGESSVKKFGAEVAVWVVVKRRRKS